jgi:stage IV sporulation protein FB
MPIIKINYLTLYLLLIAFASGYFKEAITIFIIVLIHEFGHLFMSFLCHYKVISITIYPFGGITKTDTLINSSLIADFWVYFGGLLFQIPLFFISNSLIFKYNLSIFIFNLIPILPLDGYFLLNTLLNNFFPFAYSYLISDFLSILFIIIYFIFNNIFNLNNYLIIMLFIVKLIEHFKNYPYIINRFWLERFIYDLKYNKIYNEKEENLYKMKKNSHYFYYQFGKWVDEKHILEKKFDKSPNNW